jgi:tRNA(Arg) A34 adenosine deaminase TadA
MEEAFALAQMAEKLGEVPVGAVVVERATGRIVASTYNLTETTFDPTAHAEILALREACKAFSSPRLLGCDLYVTLEPCPMCAQAISFARIERVYFAAYDVKGGGVDHGARIFEAASCHHKPEIYGGIREKQAAVMLQNFFKERRE